ncbi:MAG: transposase [Myxococcota bacterium]
MFHVSVRARKGSRLFRTWEEGLALWRILARTFPELVALCIMPDHIHLLLPHGDPERRLTHALAAFARWRNARRGEHGVVWADHAPPEALPDPLHARRTHRYVHLNPCRKHLVADPLAWPLSTHRDAVGLAAAPIMARERDPERFHRYVSADPTVDVAGSELPGVTFGDPRLEDVVAAVSAVCRVPTDDLLVRGPARTLALKTAAAHGLRDGAVLAARFAVDTRTVQRTTRRTPNRGARLADEALSACVRAVGDPRFAALDAGDLRRLPTWACYRGMR